MPLNWFNTHEAVAAGVGLADQFAMQAAQAGALEGLLQRVDSDVRPLRLNFFKRAKFANSFKWRLLEKGVDTQLADQATQALLLRLSLDTPAEATNASSATPAGLVAGGVKDLLTRGNSLFASGDYAGALACYEKLADLKPRSADALNNVGAALVKLSRWHEAEDFLRRAVKLRPDYPEAHSNLGAVLQWRGLYPEAETSLRRALKSRPTYIDARCLLGVTLTQQNRLSEARAQFARALRIAPRHVDALIGMGQADAMDGQFAEAETWFKRALEVSPNAPSALAALTGLRKMTAADRPWLEHALQVASGDLPPTEEAALRFAIGKYYDDTGDFKRAFESYRNANDLVKASAESYRPDAHGSFVDDLIASHPRADVAKASLEGSSASAVPVLVVGMLRSGTTLVEQIIASHPSARGAGDLGFWRNAGRKYEREIRAAPLEAPLRQKLAEQYLRDLTAGASEAIRVVDKAPIDSDYLGVFHTIFPNARIIYVRRNAIDTCLSCYFQQFSQGLTHTMDLSDLAEYYRQHHRLMEHWRAVLPPETLLDVPYEGLVTDPELWTRRMLEFIGLEWDARCLDFHKTQQTITSASSWQVRQKIYTSSVERWRHYAKFVGPLLELKKLDA